MVSQSLVGKNITLLYEAGNRPQVPPDGARVVDLSR
jgi:hypothetical protein